MMDHTILERKNRDAAQMHEIEKSGESPLVESTMPYDGWREENKIIVLDCAQTNKMHLFLSLLVIQTILLRRANSKRNALKSAAAAALQHIGFELKQLEFIDSVLHCRLLLSS